MSACARVWERGSGSGFSSVRCGKAPPARAAPPPGSHVLSGCREGPRSQVLTHTSCVANYVVVAEVCWPAALARLLLRGRMAAEAAPTRKQHGHCAGALTVGTWHKSQGFRPSAPPFPATQISKALDVNLQRLTMLHILVRPPPCAWWHASSSMAAPAPVARAHYVLCCPACWLGGCAQP